MPVHKLTQTAIDKLVKDAERGDPQAQYELGASYDSGEGFVQDHKKAVEWFQKAADQGYAPAQCDLGVSYYRGQGVKQDYEKAFTWYKKAIEQGNAQAQYNLAIAYHAGKGVEQDIYKANEYYAMAANAGHQRALESLNGMLSELLEDLSQMELSEKFSEEGRQLWFNASSVREILQALPAEFTGIEQNSAPKKQQKPKTP